ncbi:hypothetical protein GCM10010383_71670 [Streptomyces lomondensis]|uniref:Secreted protein n=1 Tax=Streptomyces lomondensis TaxID=68229 RepID=A0ABQ2XSN0_9ACTN|nr:hypothetical protein GCM10010383_71670 [Streptomyces lomondensis]
MACGAVQLVAAAGAVREPLARCSMRSWCGVLLTKGTAGGGECLFETQRGAHSLPADGEDEQAEYQKAPDSREAGGTQVDDLLPQDSDGRLDGVQREHRDGGHHEGDGG